MQANRLLMNLSLAMALALPAIAGAQSTAGAANAQKFADSMTVSIKQAEAANTSHSISLDSRVDTQALTGRPVQMSEPFTWVLALGFLAMVILRRTRSSSMF